MAILRVKYSSHLPSNCDMNRFFRIFGFWPSFPGKPYLKLVQYGENGFRSAPRWISTQKWAILRVEFAQILPLKCPNFIPTISKNHNFQIHSTEPISGRVHNGRKPIFLENSSKRYFKGDILSVKCPNFVRKWRRVSTEPKFTLLNRFQVGFLMKPWPEAECPGKSL